ncbi:MAG TPA: hypothetical protein DCZ92_06770 [Elusimicrobia bacterium]|nr:MAG: hypothetical protein A2016_05195 [Elusimicrobia bacterium GWF2_62_30]HBA60508.1 hypothetical protein [Elusimicrobiota bacterium]
MTQKTILVIEDETIWHKLYKKILSETGFHVHIAATCGDGIRLAKSLKPDCIVLDFHLPDGDAVAVCSAIQADESIKGIPVIICSSDTGAEEAAYTQCKAAHFMLKGLAALVQLPGIIGKLLVARTKTTV